MAHIPQSAAARFDPKMGWQEWRRRPGAPNPFAVRGTPEAARFDDDDGIFGRPPVMRRWTGASDGEGDSGFGLVLAAIAVVLIVVLLIGATLLL